MKALRLKLFQETACYKQPFAFKVSETYPLPPYSTVKGLLHAVLEANEFIPMNISIQGIYETLATDYQTHYFFKKKRTNEFPIIFDGLNINKDFSDITSMPIYMHILFNVQLLIHVKCDQEILKQLETKIRESSIHLSLGRWEDLVRVDECEIVELENCDVHKPLPYNAYIPEEILYFESYFPYKLNWKYRIIEGVRVWDKISVGYMQKGQSIQNMEEVLIDSSGDLVFFPNAMN